MSGFSRLAWVRSVAICLVVALAAFVLAALFGEQTLVPREVFEAGSTSHLILWSVRLPRVVLAALVGAALAGSGALLQSLLRNPLADPFVLGVSGGAALGASIALAFGTSALALVPSLAAVSGFALLGALGAMALVMFVSRLAGGGSNTMLLAGVIFNAFALAATLFIKSLVAPDKLGEILFWLAGALGHESWGTLAVTAVVVGLALAAMLWLSPKLNLLTLGEDDAQSLGVDVRTTRRVMLVVSSIAVAAVVSLSGLVGFVGLLVPQVTRLVFGADQRIALATSPLLGAAFLMLADLAARLAFRFFNTEPPVGVVTALLGGPLFLLLMTRRR